MCGRREGVKKMRKKGEGETEATFLCIYICPVGINK